MLRFLHAGDLHLGSPLAAFSPRAAARRREREFAALEQLFADAVRRGAALLLLAGDVFDSPEPDADTAARFFTIAGAQPVPVVIAPGNHDYRRTGGFWDRTVLPQNVSVFAGDELSCFDFPALNASVWGYAFGAESAPAPDLSVAADRLRDGRAHILLAHADTLSPLSPYAPLTSGQLEACGFDYAALGHVHKPPEPRRYGKTLCAYSGFFAGRGVDEIGEGGAWLVEIENGAVRTERLASKADLFLIETLDCSGATSGEEVRSRVSKHILDLKEHGMSDDTALRLILEGDVGLSCRVDKAAIEGCGTSLALFEVRDETMPMLDAAYLEKDPTMRGAFYRAMLPHLNDTDASKRAPAAEALRLGLAALAGKEV